MTAEAVGISLYLNSRGYDNNGRFRSPGGVLNIATRDVCPVGSYNSVGIRCIDNVGLVAVITPLSDKTVDSIRTSKEQEITLNRKDICDYVRMFVCRHRTGAGLPHYGGFFGRTPGLLTYDEDGDILITVAGPFLLPEDLTRYEPFNFYDDEQAFRIVRKALMQDPFAWHVSRAPRRPPRRQKDQRQKIAMPELDDNLAQLSKDLKERRFPVRSTPWESREAIVTFGHAHSLSIKQLSQTFGVGTGTIHRWRDEVKYRKEDLAALEDEQPQGSTKEMRREPIVDLNKMNIDDVTENDVNSIDVDELIEHMRREYTNGAVPKLYVIKRIAVGKWAKENGMTASTLAKETGCGFQAAKGYIRDHWRWQRKNVKHVSAANRPNGHAEAALEPVPTATHSTTDRDAGYDLYIRVRDQLRTLSREAQAEFFWYAGTRGYN